MLSDNNDHISTVAGTNFPQIRMISLPRGQKTKKKSGIMKSNKNMSDRQYLYSSVKISSIFFVITIFLENKKMNNQMETKWNNQMETGK